jgi:hypothetical protein
MTALESLLVVQDHDTAADQLRHRRATLPERAALAEVEGRMAELDGILDEVGGRQRDLTRRQQALEDEIVSLTDKVAGVERLLYGGTVSAVRELQALQADQAALIRHRSSLEDQVLELMEAREPVDAEVARVEAEWTSLDDEAGRLRAVLADAEVVVDAELAAEEEARATAVAGVPPDLLEQYEGLRARLGGVGAARLEGGRCTGCHLSLSATELDQLRRAPPDAIHLCESCGRILVR